METEHRHIARNVTLVAMTFGLAALAGVVRNILIARQFGIGETLDAYYASFKLPDMLFTILAGGALSTAFIPVLAEHVALGDRRAAWRLTAAVMNWVVIAVGALALVAALLAPWLVRMVIAPGFPPAQQAETAAIMRVLLLSTLVFSVSGLLSSALNGFKHFLFPALSAVVYPLGVAAGALWLAPRWGVLGLAAGAVLGSLLHLLIKAPALLRFGFRWWPILQAGPGELRRVAVLFGPRILDLAVFQATTLLMTNLASREGAGAVSSLEWGWDAMQLPETVIGTAFGLVLFPTIAQYAARRELDRFQVALTESLGTVLAFAVPASVGLILLGRELLAVLYQRGAFDAQATEAVYAALLFFALGLSAHATLELAARSFFAIQDTLTPLIVAAAAGAFQIALGFLLLGPLSYAGLALANSVAVTCEVIALLWLMRRRLAAPHFTNLLRTLVRASLASILTAAALLAVRSAGDRAGLDAMTQLLLQASAGVLAYLLACAILRVREPFQFVLALAGRA
jgi:putative peptidoglycan lipid II flippase